MTFMYWWMNFIQRMKVLAAKKWYVRDNPEATGYTVDDLKKMGPANLAKKMGSYTAKIPGTKANKNYLRRLLLAMVRQIEIETRGMEPEVRDNVHGGGGGCTTADATDGVSGARAPDWAMSLASSAPSPPRGTTGMISSASSQRSKAALKITL